MIHEVSPPPAYIRRSLELRAAEYYASIRKLESEWRTIEDLQPQLSEIEHYVLAGDYDAAAEVLHAISMNYLFKWGYYVQLGKLWERLMGHIQNGPLHVHSLGVLGSVYYALGDCDRAIQFHREALVLACQIDYPKGASAQLGRLGIIYRSLFEIEQARQCHEESLRIAREIGDRAIEGYRLGDLAAIYLLLGQHQRALELYWQSVEIARERGDRWEEGIRLGGVGRVHHALGDVEQAQDYYQQVLAIAEAVGGDRQRKSEYLRELAHSYASSGQRDTAMTLCQDGLNTAREIGHRSGEAYCLLVLGRISLMNGNFAEAEQYCADARDLNVLGVNYQATLLLGIAQLYRHDPRAAMTFSEVITHCQTLLDRTANLYAVRHILAAALIGLAVCNPHCNHTQRADLLTPALAEYRRALDITTARGTVRDALHDLDLIRATGVEGLEPVFGLLEGVLNEHS